MSTTLEMLQNAFGRRGYTETNDLSVQLDLFPGLISQSLSSARVTPPGQPDYELGQTEWSKTWSKLFWTENPESGDMKELSPNRGHESPTYPNQSTVPNLYSFGSPQLLDIFQQNMVTLHNDFSLSSSASSVDQPIIKQTGKVRTLLATPTQASLWEAGLNDFNHKDGSSFIRRRSGKSGLITKSLVKGLKTRTGGFIRKKRDETKQFLKHPAPVKTNAFGEVVSNGNVSGSCFEETNLNNWNTENRKKSPGARGIGTGHSDGSWSKNREPRVRPSIKERLGSRFARFPNAVRPTTPESSYSNEGRMKLTDKYFKAGRTVVIDGESVAFNFGDRLRFDWEGIHSSVKFFKNLGCNDIRVVVPNAMIDSVDARNCHIADQLNQNQHLIICWDNKSCKRLIQKTACEEQGVVISNCLWRSIPGVHPSKLKYVMRETLKFHFSNHSSSSHFVVSEIPFGHSGPTLKQVLRL